MALELQCLAGTRVAYGKTRSAGCRTASTTSSTASRGGAWGSPRASSPCASSATCCRPSARRTTPAPFDFRRELEALRRLAQQRAFGPSTAALVRAAEERDIPWIRLNDRSLVQLGHGKYQRRIQATVTSETRHTAVEIASDKRLTNQILADLGLPVPRQELVDDAEEAVEAAERLGYPVVVKPARRQPRPRRVDQPDTPSRCAMAFDEGARTRRGTVHRREPSRRATTTASWWSTAGWSRWPSGCRGTSWATAGTPSPS